MSNLENCQIIWQGARKIQQIVEAVESGTVTIPGTDVEIEINETVMNILKQKFLTNKTAIIDALNSMTMPE